MCNFFNGDSEQVTRQNVVRTFSSHMESNLSIHKIMGVLVLLEFAFTLLKEETSRQQK